MTQILLVDDEEELAAAVAFHLRSVGYDVTIVVTAEAAKVVLKKRCFDLVLLDWLLPFEDGIHLLRWIRDGEFTTDCLVLMVTAKEALRHRLKGLQEGADGYITKPFSLIELSSRIAQMLQLKTASSQRQTISRFGALQISTDLERVWIDGEEVSLSKKCFLLLERLLINYGQIIQCTVLSEAIGVDVSEVVHQMEVLRRKVDPSDTYIQCFDGSSYRFLCVGEDGL